MRARPAQERALAPPMLEGAIWQWPINTVNPWNTNMFMLMMSQEIPGRGKRDLRAAVAEKDIALAESDVTIRERQIANEVRQAYATLFIARKRSTSTSQASNLLRQIRNAARQGPRQDASRSRTYSNLSWSCRNVTHSEILMFDEQANLATARLNILRDRRWIAPSDHWPRGRTAARGGVGRPPASGDRPPTGAAESAAQVERAEAEARVGSTTSTGPFHRAGWLPRDAESNRRAAGASRRDVAKSAVVAPKIDARVAEQSAAVEAARSRARALENGVRLGVHEAYVRAMFAQERAALIRTTILPQSQQTLDVSRVAYQADRVDFQTVIDNQRTQLDAQLDYYRALSEFEQAIADLERTIGTDLPVTRRPAVRRRWRHKAPASLSS